MPDETCRGCVERGLRLSELQGINERLMLMVERMVKEVTFFSSQKGGSVSIKAPLVYDENKKEMREMSKAEIGQQMQDLQELGIL